MADFTRWRATAPNDYTFAPRERRNRSARSRATAVLSAGPRCLRAASAARVVGAAGSSTSRYSLNATIAR